MGKLDSLKVQIEKASKFIYEKNWAELSAGNISYRFEKDEILSEQWGNWLPLIQIDLEIPFKSLDGDKILISCSEKRMTDIYTNFFDSFCLCQITDEGKKAQVLISSFTNSFDIKPSSELLSHLFVHQEEKKKNSNYKAVVHCHPNSVIAYSHINTNTSLLLEMHSETNNILSQGISYGKFASPGSIKLAEVTKKCFSKSDIAIWEKHGCTASGYSIQNCIDKIEGLDKAANIFLMIR